MIGDKTLGEEAEVVTTTEFDGVVDGMLGALDTGILELYVIVKAVVR